MYVKCGVRVKSISRSHISDEIEFMFLKISSCGSKIFIAVKYFPHRNVTEYSPNIQQLKTYAPKYLDNILAGDFNIDLLSEGPVSNA